MGNAKALVEQFNRVKSDVFLDDKAKNDALGEIAEKLINATIDCYDKTAFQYSSNAERAEIDPFNKSMWDIFVSSIKHYIPNSKDIKVLDVGSGSGRDLIYGQTFGYDMYGIEIPDGFLALLEQLYQSGKIKHKVKKCDMREIEYEDGFFDVVRHNATLLHLPVVGKGYTIDKALEETHRVLRHDGLLQVLVKAGNPDLSVHDTKEGLGARIFQFFGMDLLLEVIRRNGFEILLSEKLQNERPNEVIAWLFVMARKI